MTDAELMTTSPDVPGLEVRAINPRWEVFVSDLYIGSIGTDDKGQFYACCQLASIRDIPTRNAAVQWILDQHKSAELTRQGALEAFKR